MIGIKFNDDWYSALRNILNIAGDRRYKIIKLIISIKIYKKPNLKKKSFFKEVYFSATNSVQTLDFESKINITIWE